MENTDISGDLSDLFPVSLHARAAERIQEAVLYCLAFETANAGLQGEIEPTEEDLACRFQECVRILEHCRRELRWSPERTLRWLPELLAETFTGLDEDDPQQGEEQNGHQKETKRDPV